VRCLVCAVVLAACGDREHAERQIDQPSRLEIAIARDLTARFGVAPTVRCASIFGYPRGCSASLGGERFGIRVRDVGRTWRWDVLGLVVAVAPIEDHVRGVLDDLGQGQGVACGMRVRHLAPGDRIACDLARGGKAFVTIAADGAFDVELALDPAAAKARSEPVTGLEHRSRALAHTDESDDDEVGATTDAGVESAP
jgi:hypothetical protein